MKKILIPTLLLGFSLCSATHAVTTDFDVFTRSAVTDPSISRRCKVLIRRRSEKVQVKQTLKALLSRNKRLQSITPEAKVTISKDLIASELQIRKEIRLSNLKIQRIEENIIRKGCPGITL